MNFFRLYLIFRFISFLDISKFIISKFAVFYGKHKRRFSVIMETFISIPTELTKKEKAFIFELAAARSKAVISVGIHLVYILRPFDI
jgi:hypothetical protein